MNINKLLVLTVFICLHVAFFTSNVTGTTQSKESDVESIQATDTSKESHLSQPKIIFEEEFYDFGIAGPGESIIHTFNFINTGTTALKITRISKSCGCTTAKVAKTDVLPGEAGSVLVTMAAKRYKGKQEETVTVYSNDPGSPASVLTIHGVIKAGFAVLPQGVHFADVKKGETVTKRVQLLQLSSSPLTLNRVEANEKHVSTEVSEITEENKTGFNINITLKPEAPVGVLSEIVTLHTNLNKHPRIDIPVWANITGRIKVQPKAFSFGTVDKGGKIPQTITVYSSDGTDFNVLKVSCDLPFIHLSSSNDEKDNLVKISGTIDNISPAGRCSGSIDIYTDDTDQNVIHIPVYGIIQKQETIN
jgi:hypothetical protein